MQELLDIQLLADGSTRPFKDLRIVTDVPCGSFVGDWDWLEELEENFIRPQPELDEKLLKEATRIPPLPYQVDRLFHLDWTPRAPTELHFTDPLDVSKFEELPVPHLSLQTSRNSTSMQRQPEIYPSKSVKGSTRNFPFAFGGMDVEQASLQVSEIEEMSDAELFAGEFFSVPPGFQRGLAGAEASLIGVTEKLSDMHIEFDLVEELIAKEEHSAAIKDENIRSTTDGKHQAASEPTPIDNLLPEKLLSIESAREGAQERAVDGLTGRKTYAVMLDTSEDIPAEVFEHYVPEMAKQFPFQLDIFQKYAVMHLEKGESVFIAAHTSAGKTVVAEYAIALAQKHMTRAIYTSPIKALSNQKFRDFRLTFGDEEIGLLTGDVQIRPDSPCVIMTTEILRSMLYRGADMIRDVEFVIFDEVHYINDAERGVVWEEVIIMLPPNVTIILLSATVPNTFEFADWVGRTKKKNIYVISTTHRPVPLEYFLFVSTVVPHELFKIVDSRKRFQQDEFKRIWDKVYAAKEDKKPKQAPGKKANAPKPPPPKSVAPAPPKGKYDRNIWVNLVALLSKKEVLPVVVFTFSKKRCEEYADTLSNVDLLNAKDKSEVHVFIERSLAKLKGADCDLPQIRRMRELLGRGIGVHHGGLLPIVKELVEILFARNLIKVLFATETFAMGVNMPARAVVFSGTRKHDGQTFRDLLPGEFTQMSGRAGRRGLDETGVVILASSGESDFPEAGGLQTMILGQPTRLQSQFRLTYNMILNLLRVESIKVEDMMKRSFYENDTQRDLPEQEKALQQHQGQLEAAAKLSCVICEGDIEAFFRANSEVVGLTHGIMEALLITSPVGSKLLSPGRLVVINDGLYLNCVAAILHSTGESIKDKSYTCIVLTEVNGGVGENLFMPLPLNRLSVPGSLQRAGYAVANIRWNRMLYITPRKIAIADVNRLVNQDRDACQLAVRDMMAEVPYLLPEQNEGLVAEMDYIAKVKDFDFHQDALLRRQILQSLSQDYQCIHCVDFQSHVRSGSLRIQLLNCKTQYKITYELNQIKDSLVKLEHRLSDKNLQLLPDYHQRIQVLRLLSYIDEVGAVQLKGRVACEINSGDSLILTELIMENVLTDLDPADIAALLSVFVCQEKTSVLISSIISRTSPALQTALQMLCKITSEVLDVQRKNGVNPVVFNSQTTDDTPSSVSGSDELGGLQFALVEVVNNWAKGVSFKAIMEMTEALEGSIVRCMTRLDELCREVRDAARVIGNGTLYRKMEEASTLLKRDIVFAASLYV